MVRLGSYKVIPVDVRVIAATNKNLEDFVHGNKFRDDLYHRLNVLRLELPPLRLRGSDIRLYAETCRAWSAGSRCSRGMASSTASTSRPMASETCGPSLALARASSV